MKLYGFLALVLVIVAIIVGSFFGGVFYERNTLAVEKVSSVAILNKIENDAIVLTKTVLIDQDSTITIDKGSDWSNFWWSQTITASGLMRVNVGVDFKEIKERDITVDTFTKTISIKLPAAKVLDVSLMGDIDVRNQAGILKLIFDNDTNADYNRALTQLTTDASNAVSQNTELMADAKADSIKILQLVLKDTGYTVSFN